MRFRRLAVLGAAAALPAALAAAPRAQVTPDQPTVVAASAANQGDQLRSTFTVTRADQGGPQLRILAGAAHASRSRLRLPIAAVVAHPVSSARRVVLVAAATPVRSTVVAPPAAPVVPVAPVARVVGSGHGAAVLAAASRFAGVPYVYGGASSAGVDCSGFTMLVLASLGISLPHNAAAQYYALPHVDASAVQPGDLIFLDGLGHVGIYAGPGLMWDAPVPGQHVGLHGIYGPFLAARA